MNLILHTMLISIIIPVYNTEKYLTKCLKSVFLQKNCSFDDYEVIIVIDGSPDNSLSIAKEFEKKYENCRVVEQENLGLSQARNTGLNLARGKYVWFVDSDDWIALDAVSILVSTVQKECAEIFGFNIVKVYSNTKSVIESPLTKKIYYTYYEGMATGLELCRKMHIGVCPRYLFSLKFLCEHKLTFLPHVYFEDTEFIPKTMFFAKKIFFINNNLYYYLKRESNSIMSSYTLKHLISHLLISDSLNKFRKENANTWRENAFIYDMIHYHYLSLIISSMKYENVFKESNLKKRTLKLKTLQSFLRSIYPYFSFGKCWGEFKAILS